MKQASTYLGCGGITLFAIASVVPTSADSRRYHGGGHWRHGGGPDIIIGDGRRRYSGVGPRAKDAATSASSLVATLASGLVPTNATAMIATGDAVAGLIMLVG